MEYYQIQREDARRRITIGFNVRGRDVQTIVKELQEKSINNSAFRQDTILLMVVNMKIYNMLQNV
jgi:Cu/Ag efflux pump CusA